MSADRKPAARPTRGGVVPAGIVTTAIVRSEVGRVEPAVAYHAVCQVSGCDWQTRRYDAVRGDEVPAKLYEVAKAHAERHTAAAEASGLDAELAARLREHVARRRAERGDADA